MAEDTVEHLDGEVEPPALLLDPLERLDRLNIMPKRTDSRSHAELMEIVLAIVPEGRMSDIMTDSYSLDEVVVQPEFSPDGSGDSAEQLHVDDTVRDTLVPDEIEHLGLVDIGGIGTGVEDPVHIDGEGIPHVPFAGIFRSPAYTLTGQRSFHSLRGNFGELRYLVKQAHQCI